MGLLLPCARTRSYAKAKISYGPWSLLHQKSRPIIRVVNDPFFLSYIDTCEKVYGRFTFSHLADILNPKGPRAILDPCLLGPGWGLGPLAQGRQLVGGRHWGLNLVFWPEVKQTELQAIPYCPLLNVASGC